MNIKNNLDLENLIKNKVLICPKCHNNSFDIHSFLIACSQCKTEYSINKEGIVRFIDNNCQQPFFFSTVNLNTFSEQHNTPFFIFSEKIINDNIDILFNAAKESNLKIKIYYSVKTNFNRFILNIVKNNINHASVSSGLELSAALTSGFEGKDLSFDGPVYEEKDILSAINAGVELFNIDSYEQAVLLNRLAQENNRFLKISPRLNFFSGNIFYKINYLFTDRFGFSNEEIKRLLKDISSFKNLKLSGFAFHLGSQLNNVSAYLSAIKKIICLIKKHHLKNIKHINIGGGFPAKGIRKNSFMSILFRFFGMNLKRKEINDNFISELNREISSLFKKNNIDLEIIYQPGRYIVGDAGILVSRIFSVKEKWIFVDASVNYLPENFLGLNRRIINISKLHGKKSFKYSIAGRTLCSDIFNINVKMPRPDRGDFIVLESAGAYSLSRANNFTTVIPDIYLIKENSSDIELTKKEENVSDIYEGKF